MLINRSERIRNIRSSTHYCVEVVKSHNKREETPNRIVAQEGVHLLFRRQFCFLFDVYPLKSLSSKSRSLLFPLRLHRCSKKRAMLSFFLFCICIVCLRHSPNVVPGFNLATIMNKRRLTGFRQRQRDRVHHSWWVDAFFEHEAQRDASFTVWNWCIPCLFKDICESGVTKSRL